MLKDIDVKRRGCLSNMTATVLEEKDLNVGRRWGQGSKHSFDYLACSAVEE
jgi:hypothetical protein